MAKGIVIQIQGDGESAKRALQMVEDKIKETERAEGSLAATTDMLKRALQMTGVTLGLQEVLGKLKEIVQASGQFAEQIQMASVRTGLSTETLSVLHHAAALTHGDFDQMQAAIGKFGGTMAEAAGGNVKAASTFKALGINVKELAETPGGVEKAFFQLVKVMGETDGESQRLALAKRALGKAGQEFIPVLVDLASKWDEYSASTDRAGVKMDATRTQKLAELDDAFDQLEESIFGAGMSLTEGMTTPLQQMMQVISDGKGDRAQLIEWGHDIVRVLSAGAMAAYGLAAGFKGLQVLTDIDPDQSAEDRASMKRFDAKSQAMRDIMLGKTPAGMTPPSPSPPGTGKKPKKPGKGFVATTPGKPGKSLNPIAEARAQLAEEVAKRDLDFAKARGAAELAEAEAQHKLLLTSDQKYFDEKFAIQNRDFDAEQSALDSRRTTLEKLKATQHALPLHRDKNGDSAEELKTRRELVQLEEQQAQLTGKRLAAESAYNAEVGGAARDAEIAGMRALADLEKERNDGIEAQILLLKAEAEISAQKLKLQGGTDEQAQAVRDTADLAAQKLRVHDADDAISKTQAEYSRQIDQVNDKVSKGDLSQRQGREQVAALQQREAAALDGLVQKYRELAEASGDPDLVEKAKQYSSELEKLGRPDQSHSFGHEVREGLQGITTSLAETAALGKQSFGDMVNSMIQDLARLALKMEEERFLAPLFEGVMGGGKAKGAASGGFGGAFGLPSIAGAGELAIPDFSGPKLYKPPSPSFASAGFGGTLAGLAQAAAGKLKPAVTTNLINQSSQALKPGDAEPRYDQNMGQWIIDILLHDHATGGPVRQLYGQV